MLWAPLSIHFVSTLRAVPRCAQYPASGKSQEKHHCSSSLGFNHRLERILFTVVYIHLPHILIDEIVQMLEVQNRGFPLLGLP